MNKDITNWLYKYNLDHRIFYSNFSIPKMNFEVKNSHFSEISYYFPNLFFKNKLKKNNNKNNTHINLKIKSDFFIQEIGITKWDYILENYFNHFNINKFSEICIINIKSNINPKDKIKNFYNIDNIYIIKKKIILKKKYDLILIFPHDYQISNKKKKINDTIYIILTILLQICDFIDKRTIIHISYLYEITANSCDLIFFLENFFDLTFFSEYKLQDIDKQTLDIILSNGRDLIELKENLKNILKIYKKDNIHIGFIKYKYIPKKSSFFIYKKICAFLHNRYYEFLKLKFKNEDNLKNLYKKIFLNQIFTQDIKHTNVLQLPFFIQLLNKYDSLSKNILFKEGNILYNFIIDKKINNVFQFGFYNGYISIFILMALNKISLKNKLLITIDSRQQKYYQSKGINLLKKMNIFENHLLIENNVYTYLLSLIEKNKKFKLIILHNILVENFQELMIQFYFSLQIIKKEGYIYLEKINFPKIKKMISYINTNLFFLDIYYKNSNSMIYKVTNYKLLEKYLNKDPLKEYTFYNF